jgi:hypothetical protein
MRCAFPPYDAEIDVMPYRQTLLEKIQALPPERIAEVEDFVDFIAARTRRQAAMDGLLAIAPGLDAAGAPPMTDDEIDVASAEQARNTHWRNTEAIDLERLVDALRRFAPHVAPSVDGSWTREPAVRVHGGRRSTFPRYKVALFRCIRNQPWPASLLRDAGMGRRS